MSDPTLKEYRPDRTQGSTADGFDEEATLKELASLSLIEYGRLRKKKAKEIGLTAGLLDAAVNGYRKKNVPDSGEGPSVLLPEVESWETPVDGAVLIGELEAAIKRRVVMPEGMAAVVAHWVLFAHTHDAHIVSPILAILAPERECGKSTLLDTISWLVPRPLPSSGTSPAVFTG